MLMLKIINTDYIFVSPWNNRLFGILFFLPWHSEDYINKLYEMGYNDVANNYQFI